MLLNRSGRLLGQIRFMSTKITIKENGKPPPLIKRRGTIKYFYNKAFGKYLLLTNTVTSGLLMGLGDIVEQEMEFRSHILHERYDMARLGRMFLVGLADGPLHHVFYHYLEVFYPLRNLLSVTKKVLLDQLLMGPVYIVSFFYAMGILEHKSIRDCTNEVNDKFMEAYIADWILWPPAQYINFYFLPVKYQVLYINMVTMFYNIFLSYIKHRDS